VIIEVQDFVSCTVCFVKEIALGFSWVLMVLMFCSDVHQLFSET